jgi:hypothetical protein
MNFARYRTKPMSGRNCDNGTGSSSKRRKGFIAMLLKLSLLATICLLSRASEPAAARWEGLVQIPGRPVTLVVDLDQNSAGQWTGSAIVPGFGVKGTPLKDIVVHDSDVAFAIPGALGGPTLQGRVGTDGTLSGDYQQAGNKARFLLRKAGPSQVEPPRQSTAVRSDLEGEWQGDMNFAGRQLHVRLKLVNHDGKAAAQFQVTGKVERTLPFDLVMQDGELLTVESTETGLRYEGHFRKEVNEVGGTFSQGPMETELVLHRSPAQEKP